MSDDVSTILALVPNWLGDAAMCTAALRSLQNRYPEARIVAAGRPAVVELLNGLPWVHRQVVLPSRASLFQTIQTGRRLRQYRPDLAVVFPHSFRAALLARLSGARRRLAYARQMRSLFLTDAVRPAMDNGRVKIVYMAREYLDLVARLGCEDDGLGLELRPCPGVVEQVRKRLPRNTPLVGLAPGAAYGPSKRWPVDRYAAVADALAETAGARSVLLTGPGEEDVRAALLSRTRSPLIQCDDGHPTVETLKAAISQLDLLVCNDTGPRHVAVALGVPTVCIMGPTRGAYTDSPYEKGEVLRVDVDCGPCQLAVCPADHRCMTGIAAETVVAAALRVLKPEGAAG